MKRKEALEELLNLLIINNLINALSESKRKLSFLNITRVIIIIVLSKIEFEINPIFYLNLFIIEKKYLVKVFFVSSNKYFINFC